MPRKNESYETMLKKLEEIVNEMDTGSLSLEESMKKYEEGVKLTNKLYKILSEAEGKIKLFTESGEKDFKVES
ncbi:exodeoxyribonuclease VII small subunit [Clostridium carboxidivorans P7]|uniref:Exodeoxyribonuclease 7 small subunit n=1 Tax=Clostridium carboxidivorans P7 TaxID=536227 RepID=C6PQR3_9CLOT|nr:MULTISPECIES: exodeoxyribonuclease VII small subunit [Clostridium]AKN34030.1 exodeoxyribonuclease VII small subunit [Clostridium carboxidivorans P7]EET88435.1 Exonuclease VII small subunit [Clostridium carboxidivorans P7]EFG88097.1 exodeoxyribonuclease VII, small subunit [Clostridium carboxidivorans P7]WPC40910.1 exodeoxyribonuclease VII small subunit [Clostridium sp. JS66]